MHQLLLLNSQHAIKIDAPKHPTPEETLDWTKIKISSKSLMKAVAGDTKYSKWEGKSQIIINYFMSIFILTTAGKGAVSFQFKVPICDLNQNWNYLKNNGTT
jgi:hypothetical protein